MTPLQRRHRTWIAFTLASAALLFAGGGAAWGYLVAGCGIALGYAAGFCHRLATPLVAAGIVLLALGAWLLTIGAPIAIGWPALLLACALLLAATGRILAHFIRVPDRAVRAAAVLSALLFVLMVGLLALPAPSAHAAAVLCGALLAGALIGTESLGRRWIRTTGPRRARLSVMVICLNEADRIEACLQRCAGWADEIVVVDSGSTDGTTEIAGRYADRLVHADWQGYGRQKQSALDLCSGEWVLSLDADELIDEPLKREIDAWLSTDPSFCAFRICWVSMVFGKPVFFGADGRYHKRLFRRTGAAFDRAEVHEDIAIEGPVARLASPVVHDTFRNYAHLKSKFTRYALISAERIESRRKRAGPVIALLHGISAFLLLYLRRLGILDGRRGILMAVVYASYTFDKYAAAWSQKH
jgi:hypothetical protein